MVIGLLLAWMVSANGLPDVVWDRDEGVSGTVAQPGAPPAAPSPGLLSDAPAPVDLFSPLAPPVSEPVLRPPPPASPARPASAPAPARAEPSAPEPVRVVSAGYASSAAGTPLATTGVPDGSVAVARRAGQPEKISYLQLAGDGTTLTLAVDTAGQNVLDDLAELRLCVVTDRDRRVGRGDTSIEEAPEIDCSAAVAGIRRDDGSTWVFDLAGVPASARSAVAIVPADGFVPPEFQVVLRAERSTDE